MIVNVYTIGKKDFIGTYKARNVYESSFYFCNMPTLSKKTCKSILDNLYPNFMADGVCLVFENVETGHVGSQQLFRNGTILNF